VLSLVGPAPGIPCALCEGLGIIRTEKGSRPCICQGEAKAKLRLNRALIPGHFQAATLAGFEPAAGTRAALMMARRMVEEFVPGNKITGLLLTGPIGTGKTHLAVGMLRALVEEKGIEGRFVDMRELFDRLRSSYDDNARESQAQILGPILGADLVVIDELGAARPSDWVFETCELLIGGLYNREMPVIVTTNHAMTAERPRGADNEYARAARPETLGDRIGARMFSRLQQMCTVVEVNGPDWRARKR
jgi:DNA replication protein DnaC